MNLFSRKALLLTAAAMAIGLSGCEQDEIVSYVAPAEPPEQIVALPGAGPAVPLEELSLAWTVPAAWSVCQSPPQFVIVAYDDPTHTVQSTVSRLDGTGGGALANINRWRGQIGLPPVASLPEQEITRLDMAGDTVAALVDLRSSDTRVLGVIYPREDLNETWFFKMTGSPEGVEGQREAFIEHVLSARPADDEAETNS